MYNRSKEYIVLKVIKIRIKFGPENMESLYEDLIRCEHSYSLNSENIMILSLSQINGVLVLLMGCLIIPNTLPTHSTTPTILDY